MYVWDKSQKLNKIRVSLGTGGAVVVRVYRHGVQGVLGVFAEASQLLDDGLRIGHDRLRGLLAGGVE